MVLRIAHQLEHGPGHISCWPALASEPWSTSHLAGNVDRSTWARFAWFTLILYWFWVYSTCIYVADEVGTWPKHRAWLYTVDQIWQSGEPLRSLISVIFVDASVFFTQKSHFSTLKFRFSSYTCPIHDGICSIFFKASQAVQNALQKKKDFSKKEKDFRLWPKIHCAHLIEMDCSAQQWVLVFFYCRFFTVLCMKYFFASQLSHYHYYSDHLIFMSHRLLAKMYFSAWFFASPQILIIINLTNRLVTGLAVLMFWQGLAINRVKESSIIFFSYHCPSGFGNCFWCNFHVL